MVSAQPAANEKLMIKPTNTLRMSMHEINERNENVIHVFEIDCTHLMYTETMHDSNSTVTATDNTNVSE